MGHWASALATAAESATSGAIAGETGSLYGRVMRMEEPGDYAQVVIPKLRRGVQTNEEGYFRLVDLPAGTYAVQVLNLGCDRAVRSVEIEPGAEDTLLVVLNCMRDDCRPGRYLFHGCFRYNPWQSKQAGRPCEVHPDITLESDTVYMRTYKPGERPPKHLRLRYFPNAPGSQFLGVAIGRRRFTEFASCCKCVAGFCQWVQSAPKKVASGTEPAPLQGNEGSRLTSGAGGGTIYR